MPDFSAVITDNDQPVAYQDLNVQLKTLAIYSSDSSLQIHDALQTAFGNNQNLISSENVMLPLGAATLLTVDQQSESGETIHNYALTYFTTDIMGSTNITNTCSSAKLQATQVQRKRNF